MTIESQVAPERRHVARADCSSPAMRVTAGRRRPRRTPATGSVGRPVTSAATTRRDLRGPGVLELRQREDGRRCEVRDDASHVALAVRHHDRRDDRPEPGARQERQRRSRRCSATGRRRPRPCARRPHTGWRPAGRRSASASANVSRCGVPERERRAIRSVDQCEPLRMRRPRRRETGHRWWSCPTSRPRASARCPRVVEDHAGMPGRAQGRSVIVSTTLSSHGFGSPLVIAR